MKKILLSFALIGLLSFSPTKMVKIKVADGISVDLPSDLQPMTPEDIAQRYPSVRAPLAAYTDVNRSLDFGVNVSATQWPDANLEMASKFFKASINNLYDRVDFISEGIKTVHKKKLIYFEFESRVNGNKLNESERQPVYRYSYVEYYLEPKRTLVFSFNCPKGMKDDWQPTVHTIMNSVRIK